MPILCLTNVSVTQHHKSLDQLAHVERQHPEVVTLMRDVKYIYIYIICMGHNNITVTADGVFFIFSLV